MKWTEEQIDTLKKLCFEEKSNTEIAITLQRSKSEIYAKRSQLGITREKVRATKSQDTQQKYTDNRPELMRRLRAEYNLPDNDPIAEAILEAVVLDINHGYAEIDPVREKHKDLICPWCGKLHYRTDCQEKLKAKD